MEGVKIDRYPRRFGKVLLGVVLLAGAWQASAQEDNWRYEVSASLWTGNTGVEVLPEGFPDPVQIELPDFLDNFQVGLVLRGEVRKRKLGLVMDVGYIQLTASDEPDLPSVDKVSVDVNSTLATLSGIFRAHDGDKFSLDIMPGLQFYNSDSNIAVSGDMSGFTSGNRSLWDPVLGVRLQTAILKKLKIELYGNVGGFGASSQSTSQFIGSLGYNLLEVLSLRVGYRLVNWEFDEGTQESLLSQRISGLVVGCNLSF